MFEIWNFGQTRKFPSPQGNIEILRSTGFLTRDKELADYLTMYDRISCKEIDETADYEKLPMKELHHIASVKKVEGFFGTTKKKLIALILKKISTPDSAKEKEI